MRPFWLVEPSPFSFNYRYWEKGLDSWKGEYDRIYGEDYERILAKSGASFSFEKT
jgi:hypothetical protein